jgi:hypothetical protein
MLVVGYGVNIRKPGGKSIIEEILAEDVNIIKDLGGCKMEKIKWLFATIGQIPWWLLLIYLAYAIYFISRAREFWDATTNDGLRKGYKYAIFGSYPKDIRLYHIFRIVFDIPPAIIGLFFPAIRKILSLKIYTFKEEEKTEK